MSLVDRLQIYAAGLLGDAPALGIPENELTMTSLGDILNAVYFIAGVIAVIVLIIAGLNYTTAGGDASKLTKAKNMIVYTVVGLIIILSAFAITNLVLGGAP